MFIFTYVMNDVTPSTLTKAQKKILCGSIVKLKNKEIWIELCSKCPTDFLSQNFMRYSGLIYNAQFCDNFIYLVQKYNLEEYIWISDFNIKPDWRWQILQLRLNCLIKSVEIFFCNYVASACSYSKSLAAWKI